MLATLSDMPEALRGYQSPHAQVRPAPRVGVGHGAKRACAWRWVLAVVAHAPGLLRIAGEKARWDGRALGCDTSLTTPHGLLLHLSCPRAKAVMVSRERGPL